LVGEKGEHITYVTAEKLRTEFACMTPKIKFWLTAEHDLYLTVRKYRISKM
jgi:hypothetical protein